MKTDVLIIGSGLAGLYTALHIDERLSVLFVTKETGSSSWLAQGGIAAAVAKDDTPEYHVEDTLSAGAGLCDEQAVRVLAAEGPEDIRRLMEMRVPFDLDEEGDLAITREGGHTRNRVVHAGGDATGRETVRVLMKLALERPNVTFLGDCFVTRLLTEDGAVCGAAALADGKNVRISARFIVLATGGLGQIYGRTTNPSVSTGDGFALALQAGAELRDMEFVQFHPTGLYDPERVGKPAGGSAFLITEAIRGEGAVLRNGTGERFTQELAPRDVVSRAIIGELARTGEPCVYLDTGKIPEEHFRRRFPTVYEECGKRGVDTGRIPVGPVQHYQVGGVRTDIYARTTVSGLYAVGEVSCTGVHGANRLASNSMLECLVFGRRCAESMNNQRTERRNASMDARRGAENGHAGAARGFTDEAPKTRIRAICDRDAGVIRTVPGLLRGLQELDGILREMPNHNTREWAEARNMALSARAVLSAAHDRRESAGTHYIEKDGATDV